MKNFGKAENCLKVDGYELVDFDQGTRGWLEWRSLGIGASDAPTIMGENPWKRAAQLLEEKCGNPTADSNSAMSRGTALEPVAREKFEEKFGVKVSPACIQARGLPWLRASVDGISADANRVVEIKCGESVYRKTSLSRKVPEYYIGQLQHILAITNLGTIDFWCYLPHRPEVHLVVARDDMYIEKLLEAERLFWDRIVERRSNRQA